MTDQKISIPGSSFVELSKIIVGYTYFDEGASLDEISKRTHIGKITISRNNAFLGQVGLITAKTVKKRPTDICRTLGLAILHDQEGAIIKFWREIITKNDFLSGLISTVRLQKGMTQQELASHVLYAAGLDKGGRNNTGANTIVEILKKAQLLKKQQESDKLIVTSKESSTATTQRSSAEDIPSNITPTTSTNSSPTENQKDSNQMQFTAGGAGATPNITINIELKIPPTENPVIYENLFSALRKNLLPPFEDNNEK